MSDRRIKIGDKMVLLSQPYIAPSVEVIGREEEIKLILSAWIGGTYTQPKSPLLVGEPGLGKSEIVYECARLCGKELYSLQGHEDLTAEDLICTIRISDNFEKKIDYILSGLGTAMKRGGVFFLDGIDKMRPRALAPLEGLLDRRQYIDSNNLGERIKAEKGFRFIAAANQIDKEQLPEWIISRMRPVVHFQYPDRMEIERIIKSRYTTLSRNGDSLLNCFWQLWREKYGNKPPAPRDAIDIFGIAQNIADYEAMKDFRPYTLEYNGNSSVIREKHLKQAVNYI